MSVLAMHPEATADPQTIRWVVPSDVLGIVGPVRSAPGAFGALLADGVLAAVTVESRAVLVRLSAQCTWEQMGEQIRAALADALTCPDRWHPAAAVTGDDVLRAALEEVLDGPVGAFIGAHGGQATIADIADGRVRLRMGGACAHCPALALTLHGRIEAELRRRHAGVIEVRAETPGGRVPRSPWRSDRAQVRTGHEPARAAGRADTLEQ